MKIARRNDLSLRLIEIFGTLMLHRTTVAAAEELGISQPSVSTAIQQLEKQLGFALFTRERGRLVPTDEAASVFEEVRPLFDQLRSVESRVRDLRAGATGKLRVMATPPLGHSVVPRALSSFLAERPQVRVHYDVRRMSAVVDEVAVGNVELGLCLGLPNRAGVKTEVMRTDRMVALMPAGHRLAGLTVVTPADVRRGELIGLERDSRLGEAVQDAFDAQGVVYSPQVEVRYCHTAAVLAHACRGVAVVDSYTAAFLPNMDLESRPFDPAIAVPACLISREGRPLGRLARDFRAAVVAALTG